ncbi:S-layer homology domain-containing protein [Butyricicoccus intestinisimiae]|uniref:S-layer homology domain-containing protein n=1 Tax=Butyricicoccus intestinisimiae TaxID=2841509 RepID=A0ABS6EMY0_9FIRM|nr:S-layer homology domain-containing protein [Butyricicoccus intestinisimiae]MBU5489046.1 S-layer homology domain-containing protein [Butyricicoccus intestinisimiae]
MNQKFKRILSLFLSLLMGMSALPAYAAPEQAADQSSTTSQTAETNTETNKTAAKQKISASGSITVGDEQVPFSMDESDINAAMVADNSEDTTVDTSDPAVKSVKKELKNIRVKSTKADGTEEKKKLTAEQQQQVLVMFQNYQDNWKANADVLGAQLPFYMQYNDKGEDGLGVLGEMLILANKTVDDVRNGNYSFDDLVGTIRTFMYGDQLGVEYYGGTVRDKRDDAIEAVKASGAKTEYQKLLVLNDWLASQDTFDMSYIMNMGKDTPTMAAETPKDPDHYKDVHDTLYADYESQIRSNFHDQIYAGVKENFRQEYYKGAIKKAIYLRSLGKAEEDATAEEKTAANEQADAYMKDNEKDISKDPEGFIKENFGENAQAMIDGVEASLEDAEKNGVDVKGDGNKVTFEQMTQNSMATDKIADLDKDGVNEATANEAIPAYAEQAAQGLTDGVINYWESNQFGALALGKSVCLGYSKTYAYLIQCMHPEIYGKNGASTDMSKADNWKEAKDLYTFSSDGKKVNTDGNYSVDLVRITFKANVTMYGETQPDFNSDHFWNAVKVGKEWYYVDPCYTDCYSEVMTRDRVETDGYMNHMYFMFSDTTARNLYDGYFQTLNTAYKDIATDKTYEDAWFARAKSDVSSDGTNMYYVYDSTNLIKRLNDSQQDQTTTSQEDTKYKLVSHPITNKDSGDGDTDYKTLIDFTYKPDSDKDDTVVQVYNPETKNMETNDMLTELYAKHAEQADIYPSIAITCAQYEGKLYFNLSNYILSYDLTSGEVATVKKYDTVYGKRDKTNAFGGMSFALVNSADGADFTFRDHPIAGISLKSDGKLYVSVATNLAYISGKDDVSNRTKPTDSKDYTIDSKDNGYGYEFEESNYNPDYSNYSNDKYSDSMMEQFGYTREINDNDEFMWVANLRGTEAMSSIAGESVEYKKETCDHHYIHFDETYFTKKKDSDGNKTDEWNTGESYVCTVCGKSVEEPTEPKKNSMGSNSDYEKKKAQYDKDKAEYDEVVKNAGHTYTAKDPKWTKNDDGTYSVTFDTLVCSSVCEKEKNQRDCLVNDDTITIKLNNPVTAQAEITKTEGACTDEGGVKVTYTATGEAEGHKYTVSNVVETGKGEHTLKSEFKWTKLEDGGYSATVSAKCEVCGAEEKDVQAEVTSEKKDATCTEDAQITYTAKATCLGQELTETKAAEVQEGTALGHDYKKSIVWNDDKTAATGEFTCSRCEFKEEVPAEVKTETKPATCTENGETTAYAKAELKDKDGKVIQTVESTVVTETIPALGHDYESKFDWAEDGSSAKLTLTCKRGDDKQTPEVKVAKDEQNSVAATCDKAGKNVFVATATYDGKDYTDTYTVELPATGHTYKGDGVIVWGENDKSAVGQFTCDTCKAVTEVKADVTEKTDNATCTTGGKVTYTAKAELKDKDGKVLATATDTKETTVDALGHDYESKFDWAEDGSSAKLTLTCKRGDDKQTPEVKVAKDEKNSVAPTCTKAGKNVFTATATYEGKDYTDTKEVEVPATGHTYKGDGVIVWGENDKSAVGQFTCDTCKAVTEVKADIKNESKAATCTEDGITKTIATAELKDKDGKVLATATDSKETVIKATGHDYDAKFTWAEDGSSATVALTCKKCNDKQNPKVTTAKDEKSSVAPTCTEAGKNVFHATVEGYDFTDTKEVELPALGHKYKGAIKWSEDYKSANAEFTCEACKDVQHVNADVAAKTDDATCTTGGKVTYTAKAELKDKAGKVLATATESKTVDVQALGHEYESKFDWAEDASSAKATLTCKRGDDKQTIDAVIAKDEKSSVAPTCTEAGKNVFVATATYDGKDYTDTKEVAVPALGHKYKGAIKWSEDFKSATAEFTCENCKDVQTVKANVTAKTDDATCTTGGKVTYTAKAELKDKNGKVLATAADTKETTVDALGHDYESKFDWAEDASSAKATLTCKRCNDKQTVDAVVAKDEKSSVAPTCTEAGKNVFTATATYEGKNYTDTKEVAVPALGHHYVDGVCDRCGAIKLPFTDVNEGDWFYDKVAYVYHHKLMTGTSETTFEPNATLTRAMMVQILYNKEGRPAATTNGNPYTDVPKDQWYYNAVQWAYENKITSGTSETTFEPNSEVTREQFARFMYNYAGNPAVSGKLDFVDADQVSDWAYDAMVWANQNNIILGKKKSDGSVVLDPRGNATRAEAATILMGYCKAQENQ